MKVRSLSALMDALAEERLWRLKELTYLKKLYAHTASDDQQSSLARAGIAISYAHWEGFVKQSSMIYIGYISQLRLPKRDVAPRFLSMKLFELESNNEKNNRRDKFIKAIEYLRNDNERLTLNQKAAIDTESNLSSKVLERILDSLGLSIDPFKDYFLFIDNELLRRRNQICHGEQLHLSFDDFASVADKVLDLLYNFKTELENNAVQKKYLASPPLNAADYVVH